MTKVAAFHSKLPGTKVHHDNNKCTEAINIESYNRKSGPVDIPSVITVND